MNKVNLNSNTSSNTTSQGEQKKWQKYGRGDEIYASDFEIWRVDWGIVQLSRIGADGNESIVGFITTNGAFENSLSGSSVVYRAIALSDVDIQYYSEQDIADPTLAKSLLVSFSELLSLTQQLSTIMLLKNAEERLRELLLMLKQKMGIPTANGVRLQIRFTPQHLANIICSNRASIARILEDFQRQGLISLDAEQHIVIKL